MTRIRSVLAACAFALVCGTSAFAQEPPDTFPLSEIVVTATRLPAPRAAVPAAVTVLHGDELRASGVRFVADALRTVPGAAVARGGSFGALTSLFLRGGESDYVQILIDGVQVNEPGGAFDFGQLTTDHIDRIEVVRGPVGVLYGSDAVTGVVQIFTRRGSGTPRVVASMTGGGAEKVGPEASGRFTTTAWDAALTGGGARGDYSFGASGFNTQGAYAYNNSYQNRTVSGRVRLAPASRTDAALTARYTDGEFHFPTNGAGALVDRNQFSTSRSLALGLDAGHAFSDQLETRVLLTMYDFDRLTDDRPDGLADTLGTFESRNDGTTRRYAADLRGNFRFGQTILTVGGEAEAQSGKTQFSSLGQFGPFESATDDDRSNLAGYAQLVVAPHSSLLTVTAGGRVEDNQQFGSFATYRVGANYRMGSGTLFRASAGTAFKEPTFFENYAEGFVRGNPDLEPERSRSWEIGVEQVLWRGQVTVGATWFDQRFRNLIQFTSAPPAPEAPNYFNIGVAAARGVEFSGNVAMPSGLRMAGSYAYVRTKVVDEGYGTDRLFSEGRRLVRRPEHTASVSASHTLGHRVRLGVATMWVGDRDDLDFSIPGEFSGVRVVLPAYFTTDISSEYALHQGSGVVSELTFTAIVRNALNERYAEVMNFPAPRRTLMLGMRAGLTFSSNDR
jgi:vitamin B12 transporter